MKKSIVRFVTIVFAACALALSAADAEEGFRSIFDGRSLVGWETPDLSYWTVEEGAITGRITKEHPCTLNQYLVWPKDADVHGSGMEVNSAVVLVLFGVYPFLEGRIPLGFLLG